MPQVENLAGQKFHTLEAVEAAGRDHFGRVLWRCRCDCGNQVTLAAANLKKRGKRKRTPERCGCIPKNQREGQRIDDHPDANIFYSMVKRCHWPDHPSYPRYGGRGIEVCERWRAGGFWAFAEDMGPRPTPEHTLDRYPDKNGNYSPENCRWGEPCIAK